MGSQVFNIPRVAAASQPLVFQEQFTGTGAATTFQLTGTVLNATFQIGAWDPSCVIITDLGDITNANKKPLYDSAIPFTRHRIALVSISSGGLVTLNYAPRVENFYIYYWYQPKASDVLSSYLRDDIVSQVEETDPMIAASIEVDTTNFGKNLGPSDSDVQHALETIDDMAGGGGPSPATTVTSETSFGQTPAVGNDTTYAREDHNHGTPAIAPITVNGTQVGVGTASPEAQVHITGKTLLGWNRASIPVNLGDPIYGFNVALGSAPGLDGWVQLDFAPNEDTVNHYAGAGYDVGYIDASGVYHFLWAFGGEIIDTTDPTSKDFFFSRTGGDNQLVIKDNRDVGIGGNVNVVDLTGATLKARGDGNVEIPGLTGSKVVVTDANKNLASGTNSDAQISAAVTASHARSHALDGTSDHTIGGLTNTYLVKSDGSKLVPASNVDSDVSTAVSLVTGNKTANTILAGPAAAPAAAPTFRALVAADIPSYLPINMITNSGFGVWSNSPLTQWTSDRQTDYELGSNLIANGSFDVDASSWTAINCTLAASHAIAPQAGANCLLMTTNSSNVGVATQVITCVVGKLYKLVAWGQPGNVATFKIQVDGATLLSRRAVSVPSSTWTVESLIFEADQASVTISLILNTATTGKTLYFDTVSVYEITAGCAAADILACDGWTKVSGMKVWREHPGTNTKAGQMYAVKVTGDGSNGTLNWSDGGKFSNQAFYARFAGRTVCFGAWVLCSSANKAKLTITDSDGAISSSFHSGGGTYEWLEVSRAISANVTSFKVTLDSGTSTTTYFSQPMLIYGSVIGTGNYEPVLNELISVENTINYTTTSQYPFDDSVSKTVNMRQVSNGSLPKGIRGFFAGWQVKNTAAGKASAWRMSAANAWSVYSLTQVAGVDIFTIGFLACDANGNAYVYYIDANFTPGYLYWIEVLV